MTSGASTSACESFALLAWTLVIGSRELGETIGVVPALVSGAVALAVGVGALEWWPRHRPDKIVVAARRP